MPASASPSSYKTGSALLALHLRHTHKKETKNYVMAKNNKTSDLTPFIAITFKWLRHVCLLTFIKRLAQLGSHAPVYGRIGLQRHGYKERGVRDFWRRTVRWSISVPAQRGRVVLLASGGRSRRRATTAGACACCPSANMALKPRKQMNTPIYWHHCLYLCSWQIAPTVVSAPWWNLTVG